VEVDCGMGLVSGSFGYRCANSHFSGQMTAGKWECGSCLLRRTLADVISLLRELFKDVRQQCQSGGGIRKTKRVAENPTVAVRASCRRARSATHSRAESHSITKASSMDKASDSPEGTISLKSAPGPGCELRSSVPSARDLNLRS